MKKIKTVLYLSHMCINLLVLYYMILKASDIFSKLLNRSATESELDYFSPNVSHAFTYRLYFVFQLLEGRFPEKKFSFDL